MQSADRKLVSAAVAIFVVIAAELAWIAFVGPAHRGADCGTGSSSECDFLAWNSSAFWTAVFTLALTVSTALLWWQTKRLAEGADEQSKDIKRSLVIAKQTADATVALHRPWLSLEVYPRGPMLFDEKGCKIRLGIRLKNYGNTPAIYVSQTVEFLPVSGTGNFQFDAVLEKVRRNSLFHRLAKMGSTLFPKEENDIRFSGCRAPRAALDAAVANSADGRITLNLIVCVDYQYGESFGQTSKAFIVWTRGTIWGRLGTIDPAVASYDPADIILHEMPIWRTTT